MPHSKHLYICISIAVCLFTWMSPKTSQAQTWQQAQTIVEASPVQEHLFGFSSAMEGTQAMFGIITSSARLDNFGAVLVYEKQGNGWQQTQRLESPRKGQNYYFGGSVAMSQNTAAIGEYYGASDKGLVHFFERDVVSRQWTHKQQLTTSNPQVDALFGVDLDLHESYAIVASPLEDIMGKPNQGAAYIFERDAQGQWSEKAKLVAPDAEADEAFGSTVAIFGNTAIVGSTANDPQNAMMNNTVTSGGAAYIYERDAQGQWQYKQKIIASDVSTRLYFGADVSIHDNRIVVGAVGADDQGERSGVAYIFERNGAGGWDETQRIVPSTGSADSRFGAVIKQNKDHIVVGLQVRYFGGIDRAGAAYIFKKDSNGVWQETQELLPSDTAKRDDFGRTITLNERTILITSDGMNEQGKVYVFRDSTNQPPSASSQTLTTEKNKALAITLVGTDPDGDALTFDIITAPTKGSITTNNDILTYTPNLDVIGQDEFTVQADDGDQSSAEATITIDIVEPNAIPTTTALAFTTPFNTTLNETLTGTDADGDTLTFSITSPAQNGTATLLDANTGTFTYVPTPNVSGVDTFTYVAKDAVSTGTPSTVTITVGEAPMEDMGTMDMNQADMANDMQSTDMSVQDMGKTTTPTKPGQDSGCASTSQTTPTPIWMMLFMALVLWRPIRRARYEK